MTNSSEVNENGPNYIQDLKQNAIQLRLFNSKLVGALKEGNFVDLESTVLQIQNITTVLKLLLYQLKFHLADDEVATLKYDIQSKREERERKLAAIKICSEKAKCWQQQFQQLILESEKLTLEMNHLKKEDDEASLIK